MRAGSSLQDTSDVACESAKAGSTDAKRPLLQRQAAEGSGRGAYSCNDYEMTPRWAPYAIWDALSEYAASRRAQKKNMYGFVTHCEIAKMTSARN